MPIGITIRGDNIMRSGGNRLGEMGILDSSIRHG